MTARDPAGPSLRSFLFVPGDSDRKLAKVTASNAEQMAKIRRILEELSFDLASPDEARAMLETKGRAEVGF